MKVLQFTHLAIARDERGLFGEVRFIMITSIINKSVIDQVRLKFDDDVKQIILVDLTLADQYTETNEMIMVWKKDE